MIDCHSHILPGVDDGASTMEEALEMARACVASGVTHIVVTPHGNSRNMLSILEARNKAMAELRANLEKEGIPLTLIPGLEYYADGHSADVNKVPLEARCGLPPYEERPLLIELPISIDVRFAENILFNAQLVGEKVILAHPCRYGKIKANKEIFLRLMERGMYLQFNASSFIDRLIFNSTAKTITDIIKVNPEQILLGSDAHDSTIRVPGLQCAKKRVISELGEDVWDMITYKNPVQLLGIGDCQ